MKRLIKVAMLVLGLAGGLSTRASIPTFDGASFGKAALVLKQMGELYNTTMGGWLQNHKDNTEMQKTSEEIRGELDSIHKGLSGNRTEVANLAKEKPKEVVEADFVDKIMNADKDGKYSFEGSDAILTKHGLKEACEKAVGGKSKLLLNGANIAVQGLTDNKAGVASGVVDTVLGMTKTSKDEARCNNNTTRLAVAQAMLNKINSNIAERKKQIQKLADRISQTKDQKESADLTAAIAKANAEIDMDTNQMVLIKEAMANQERVDNQASMIGKK